ncbi:MAG TPA: CPBP family glutamic-type intramembrane protease [Nitrososphaera sp.]|nr:CPBP family glutamic-type intramembrane protease [Nitrososphaera sp.]
MKLAMAAEWFADEKADFRPKSWISRYRRTSLGYLTIMFLFYHGIGVVLLLVGSAIFNLVIPDYEQPSIPRSLSSVLAAGPIEETIFFGIPFYVFGNAYSVLLTGGVWVATHLFNTNRFELGSLSFLNLLFVLPSLFFSLRTWVSGKGWFSVLTHSAWNGVFFGAGCVAGEFTCTLTDPDPNNTLLTILGSAGLIAIAYVLYRRKESKERQRLAA